MTNFSIFFLSALAVSMVYGYYALNRNVGLTRRDKQIYLVVNVALWGGIAALMYGVSRMLTDDFGANTTFARMSGCWLLGAAVGLVVFYIVKAFPLFHEREGNISNKQLRLQHRRADRYYLLYLVGFLPAVIYAAFLL